METQVFVGTKPTEHQFQVVLNRRCFCKPVGGLWTSTYDPEVGSSWIEWNVEQGRFNGHIDTSPVKAWALEIDEEAKVFVIDSKDDTKQLDELGCLFVNEIGNKQIDFEKLAGIFDGVHFTENARGEDWLSISLHGSDECVDLYGWDVESTVWFRWMFKNIEELEGVL